MNKARNRKFYTKAEEKQRLRIAQNITKAFNSFKGFYKYNEID